MSFKLMFGMGITIVLLFGIAFGLLAAIGYYFNFSSITIVILAFVIAVVQWLVGPWFIWGTTNMRPIEKTEYPWIWETLREISKKNNVNMPKKIALVRNGSPNAFVFGRTPGSATLAITQGLLNSLSKEEVKAVISHEMGHIKHKDMVVMTVASVIPMIAYYIALNFMYRNNERRNAGTSILIGIGAYFVYFISNLLILSLSRFREYYADEFGGTVNNPKLLASALAKITYGLGTGKGNKNDSLRSFYIADPVTAGLEISKFSSEYADFNLTESELKKAIEWERKNPFSRISELFRTHPLTFKRIDALMRLDKRN